MNPKIEREFQSLFRNFGVSLEEVDKRLRNLKVDHSTQRAEGLLSLCLSMASIVISQPKNILELGTGLGERTVILSGLFPRAQIYTLDLPGNDSDFHRLAWRRLPKKIDGLGRFNRNIDRENITYINSNSFFLPLLGLPKKFELILVDGSHTYPAIAWDVMFSYSCLREGGFMFIHDYSIDSKVLKVKEVVEYIKDRIDEKIWYFPGSVNVEEFDKNMIPCIRKGDYR